MVRRCSVGNRTKGTHVSSNSSEVNKGQMLNEDFHRRQYEGKLTLEAVVPSCSPNKYMNNQQNTRWKTKITKSKSKRGRNKSRPKTENVQIQGTSQTFLLCRRVPVSHINQWKVTAYNEITTDTQNSNHKVRKEGASRPAKAMAWAGYYNFSL